jgi:hypothetical protein
MSQNKHAADWPGHTVVISHDWTFGGAYFGTSVGAARLFQ